MSFGFGFGDFVAALKIANDLYKDIYLAGRAAPQELQLLRDDIGLLAQSIQLLIDEVKNPDSTLVCAGPIRVEMVNTLMSRCLETLRELQTIKSKHINIDAIGRSKIKRMWDKTKWALDVPSIEALRAKIQVHNGYISLLLTSAGNSSLERVEKVNKEMTRDIEDIKGILSISIQAPVISSIDDDGQKMFQISLSHAFMNHAEKKKPWLAIGFDEWLYAGRWWLLRSQDLFFSTASQGTRIPPQAYADLLKASWILIDIIANHPQQRFWSPTGEYLQVQLLSETIKRQLTEIKSLNLVKPGLDEIQEADLKIWDGFESPFSMKLEVSRTPAGRTLTSWRMDPAYDIFWRGFGVCNLHGRISAECVLSLVLQCGTETTARAQPRLVAQSQNGVDLYNFPVTQLEVADDIYGPRENKSYPYKLHFGSFGETECPKIFLKSKLAREALVIIARALLWGLKCLDPSGVNNTMLRGTILLLGARSHSEDIIRKIAHEIKVPIGHSIEETLNLPLRDFTAVSQHIAATALQDIHSDPTRLSEIQRSFNLDEGPICAEDEKKGNENRILRLRREDARNSNNDITSADNHNWDVLVPYWLYEIYAVCSESLDSQRDNLLPEPLRYRILEATAHYGDILNLPRLLNQVPLALEPRNIDSITTSILLAIQSGSGQGLDLIATFCLELPSAALRTIVVSDAFSAREMFKTLCQTKTWRYWHRESSYKLSKQGRVLLGFLLPKISSAYGHLPKDETINLLTYLLDLGADLDRYVCENERYDASIYSHAGGFLPVHLSPALCCAASAGCKDIVVFLLDRGADVNRGSIDGSTPLHFASCRKAVEIVRILLERGASIEAVDYDGNTPLHCVPEMNHKNRSDTIICLIEYGSPVHRRNNAGFEPIHVLAANSPGKYGDSAMKALLRAGASVGSKTNEGETPLTLVVKNWREERWSYDIILLLLAYGADPTPCMHSDTRLQALFERALVVQAQAQAQAEAQGISISYPLSRWDLLLGLPEIRYTD